MACGGVWSIDVVTNAPEGSKPRANNWKALISSHPNSTRYTALQRGGHV